MIRSSDSGAASVRKIAACSLALVLASAVSGQELELRGVRIETGTGEPWAGDDRIVAREGRIAPPGSPAVGDALRIDLQGGGYVYPGFQDAHGHLEGLGASLAQVDLVGTRSYEEIVDLVRARAAQTPPGTWILGRGWDQNDWSDSRMPSHEELSSSVPDHPVVLTRIDGHALLANWNAMQAAGIDDGTPSPDGGEVVREDGIATGVFVDRAMALVLGLVPDVAETEAVERLLAAQRRCLALGLTCVHDAGMDSATIERVRRLALSGQWILRVYAMLPASEEEAVRKGPWQTPDRRLTVRAVKGYADGALGSRGAAMLAPYADRTGWRGLLTTPPTELARISQLCADHGFQFCVHAIGDAANRTVLDAFEATEFRSGRRAARFRVEHAQIVDAADAVRFSALGVLASMQPTHLTSDMPWAPTRLGPERVPDSYAWRRLLDAGVVVPFGSDFPVERVDPRLGFYAAVTTRSPAADQEEPGEPLRPDQQLSRAEALRGFTAHAAYASFFERDLGSIEEGKLADFTVFDRDLLTCPEHELLEAQVLLTVIGGEVVYAADGVLPPQSRVDPRELRQSVEFLASDALAGRDSPSEGLERAADWIASGFAQVGLGPLGDRGTYFHRFSLPGVEGDSAAISLTVTPLREGGTKGDPVRLQGGTDVRFWRVGRPFAERMIETEVRPLARVPRRRSSAPTIMVVEEDSPIWARSDGVVRRVSARLPGSAPVLVVRRGVVEPGRVEAVATVPGGVECEIPLRNVVGALPGSDLPDEYVLVTAHYDHIGVRPGAGDDVIYNGADDNATGVAAVLSVARQLARGGVRTKRTVVFVAFAAEEQGILGSKAFVERCPVPLDRVVAVVNMELLGRPAPQRRNRAWVTGSDLSDFAEIAKVALARRGVELVDFPLSDRLFAASDNIRFARRGVVAHSISSSDLHDDYHGPDDEVSRIDFDHMATVVGGIRELVVELANRAERPAWNEAGEARLDLPAAGERR